MPAGCTAALRTVQSRDPVLLSAQGLSHASLGVSLPPSGAQPRALSRSKWGLSTCQHPAGAEDPDLQGSLACPRGLPGTRHRLQGAPTGPAVDTQLCRTQAAGHAGGKALSRWTHLGRALESTRHRLCTFSAFVSVLCYPAFADLATGPAPGPCPRCPVQPGRGWLALTVGAWQKPSSLQLACLSWDPDRQLDTDSPTPGQDTPPPRAAWAQQGVWGGVCTSTGAGFSPTGGPVSFRPTTYVPRWRCPRGNPRPWGERFVC
ncbi:uncharacterized protein [Kogia breviceps]|uniref:uncharacterized protein isoform X1 n=1 Tax=Kogia breviceps TaxID=27615 RepID=UPI0034D37127